jgi:hypothetical protein
MAVARIWDEEWSPSEEYGRELRLVEPVVLPLRTGVPVSRRRAARARMLRRRRRAAVAVAVVMSAVILAWPGHAFGGETGSGLPIDQANSTVLASGMVYVVQPGDTVNSIARQMNPWQPNVARRALVHELGSTVVVPGEHVLVP